MFRSARLQLTLWYAISMVVLSLAFSLVVYQALGLEVARFDQLQREQFEESIQRQYFPNASHVRILSNTESELVTETKARIRDTLIFINVMIVIGSTVLGYFLADRTLNPIKRMLEDQKRFISDASHELRTPLTSLRTALEVFLREKQPKLIEAKTVIQEALADVQHLQDLTNSLLQLSVLENHVPSSQFQTVDLGEIITKAIKKVSPLSQKKHITLANKVKPVSVQADAKNLSEVFTILLDNAIKYSPTQTTVRLSSQTTAHKVIITISDEGSGINPDEITHIFDRFYRADAARTQSQKNGYGLGLSIARKIMTEHQGTIAASSQVGVGSSFTVTLPLHS